MKSNEAKIIREVMDALDDYLGDTDPHFDDDMSDDEIRDKDPVFWAHLQLSKLKVNP